MEITASSVEEATRKAMAALGIDDPHQVQVEILDTGLDDGVWAWNQRPVRVRIRRADEGFGRVSREMPEALPETPAPLQRKSMLDQPASPPRGPRRKGRRGASNFRSWDNRKPSIFLGEKVEEGPRVPVTEQGIEPSKARPREKYVPNNEDNDAVVEVTHELMKAIGLEYEVEFDHGEYQRAFITLPTRRAGALIGRRGASIDALEHLLERMISQRRGHRVPVQVDVNDYRFRHYEELRELARDLADRVRETGEEEHVEPMSPRDRRVVHLEIQELGDDLVTFTVGEGSSRHIVIAKAPEK